MLKDPPGKSKAVHPCSFGFWQSFIQHSYVHEAALVESLCCQYKKYHIQWLPKGLKIDWKIEAAWNNKMAWTTSNQLQKYHVLLGHLQHTLPTPAPSCLVWGGTCLDLTSSPDAARWPLRHGWVHCSGAEPLCLCHLHLALSAEVSSTDPWPELLFGELGPSLGLVWLRYGWVWVKFGWVMLSVYIYIYFGSSVLGWGMKKCQFSNSLGWRSSKCWMGGWLVSFCFTS